MDLTLRRRCIVVTLTGLEEIGSSISPWRANPFAAGKKPVFTRDDILLEADFEENN
jgi:hypothetical protein